jgi:hypothetical protein
MKRLLLSFPMPLLALLTVIPGVASALCTDPKTWVSGYRVPFQEELNASIAIVVGDAIEEQKVFETADDPEMYSVIFTVRVEQVLKGNPLGVFKLRMDLDSGRYEMGLGERHLLFITKWRWKVRGADYVINSCGNSSTLPEGNDTLARTKQALRDGAHAL